MPLDVCGKLVVTANVRESPGTSRDSGPSTSKNSKKGKVQNPSWKKSTSFSNTFPQDSSITPLSDQYTELIPLQPVDLFYKIFPKNYLEFLASMTQLYAAQKGEEFRATKEDIAQFFGLLLLSGYHTVPTEDMYWGTGEDIAVPIVATVMCRQKFRDLKKYFHVMDNTTLKEGNKLEKLLHYMTS
jgi:hypothetical protein